MKRLLISLVLLLTVGGVCGLSLYTQRKNVDTLLDHLEQMEAAYQAKDRNRCQQLSDSFPSIFDEKTESFSLFLHHDYVSAVKEVAVTLPVILREKDDSHYLAELVRCRSLLQKLEELETPSLSNIL